MRHQEEVEDGEMGLSKKKRERKRERERQREWGNFLEISANLPNGTLTKNVGPLFREGGNGDRIGVRLPAGTIGNRQVESSSMALWFMRTLRDLPSMTSLNGRILFHQLPFAPFSHSYLLLLPSSFPRLPSLPPSSVESVDVINVSSLTIEKLRRSNALQSHKKCDILWISIFSRGVQCRSVCNIFGLADHGHRIHVEVKLVGHHGPISGLDSKLWQVSRG